VMSILTNHTVVENEIMRLRTCSIFVPVYGTGFRRQFSVCMSWALDSMVSYGWPQKQTSSLLTTAQLCWHFVQLS